MIVAPSHQSLGGKVMIVAPSRESLGGNAKHTLPGKEPRYFPWWLSVSCHDLFGNLAAIDAMALCNLHHSTAVASNSPTLWCPLQQTSNDENVTKIHPLQQTSNDENVTKMHDSSSP